MKITTAKILITLGLLSLSASSIAQWQWMDRSGRKVFSDHPPPADVPEKNILKRPGGTSTPLTVVSEQEKTASTSQPAITASAPQPTASEPGLTPEQKKKQQEEKAREAAKRKAEEEKIARAKQENCQRAKSALATLQTGMRMRTIDTKGEPTILDDKGRSAEEARLKDIISKDC